MRLPRLRVSQMIVLVVYAALIGNAVVASFLTPDSPAPVQVSPSIYVTSFRMGPPGLLAEHVTVDAEGDIWLTNGEGQGE